MLWQVSMSVFKSITVLIKEYVGVKNNAFTKKPHQLVFFTRCSLFSHTFVAFAENWVILGVFYYPALYYPLLACGTLHNKVGYVLGSLLSWTHFGVLVWQKIDCPKTPLVSKDSF